jgi:hypothetical protein
MQQNEPTGGGWLSFRLAAQEVERWRGCSWGTAQKAVIDACNKGELRWRRSSQGGPDVFDVDLRRWLQQPVARPRATKKRDLAELAVKHLWPNGIPKEFTNKQIVKQSKRRIGLQTIASETINIGPILAPIHCSVLPVARNEITLRSLKRAFGLVEQIVQYQATLLSYIDVFAGLALIAAVHVPIAFLLLRPAPKGAAAH